jgi:hypothetical protein
MIDAVHLRRDLQWHAGSNSDIDRAIWPFFWGDSTQEGEITAGRFRLKWEKITGAVMNGSNPVC